MIKKIIISIVMLALILTGCSISEDEVYNGMEVTIFNTGKSDCILISIEGRYIMIDTSLDKYGEEICKKIKGINNLDYLILTHMDKDHIGGASDIINNIKIDNIIQADYSKESEEYTKLIKAEENNNSNVELLLNKKTLFIGETEINIIPGEKRYYEDSNNYSIMVTIKYGNTSFLFAGDAEEERLQEFLDENMDKYDFIKIPHHGEYNKLSGTLIKSIEPKYGVITCSKSNMPDDKLLQVLSNNNVEPYLTVDGEIKVYSNGETIEIKQ
ncbi:MAG: MBL fold metallo-hydrolase [Clostridiales bacterium]|nr:MBL fold metallo-hydrolase [Clostridiales bacterium]